MSYAILLFVGGMLMSGFVVGCAWLMAKGDGDAGLFVDIVMLVVFVFGMFCAASGLLHLDALAEAASNPQ